MDTKKQLALFYVGQNSGFYYDSSQVYLSIDYGKDTISDQEVINKEKLYETITNFSSSNKIDKATLLILLSPEVTYVKEFNETIISEIENLDIKDFIDAVPFEEVASRVYKLAEKIKIVAANSDLLKYFSFAFEKQGSVVAGAIPYVILQEVIPELSDKVDFAVMMDHFDLIKQYAMIEKPKIALNSSEEKETSKSTKARNKTIVYGLAGLLGVLLLAMLIMAIGRAMSSKPLQTQNARVIQVNSTDATRSGEKIVPLENSNASVSSEIKF